MITNKRLSLRDVFIWSLRDMIIFFILSFIPIVLFKVFGFEFLHLPWTPIAVLGTAVAFVIGFKNSASYDRTWEARKIWGGIVNASRSWGIMVKDYINNHHAGENALNQDDLKDVKLQIINRHIAWMAAHRYTLRTPKPWEDSFGSKSNVQFMEKHGHIIPEKQQNLSEALSPYLSAEDLQYVMSKNNKATALISLQSKQIADLAGKGLIWEFSHLEMKNMLVEFYTLQGKNERIKNFPFPRQFATLNFMFVWLFIILLPYGVMSVFDDTGAHLLEATTHEHSLFGSIYENFIWLTIPFCMIISWVYNALERIGETLENPFEGLPTDIPITAMSRGIEIDLLDILDVENIPEKLTPTNGIQM